MAFESLLNTLTGFFHQYPYLVAVIAVVLLIIVYKNPKGSFKFGLLLLVLAALFYAVGLFRETTSTAVHSKNQGIERVKQLDE